MLRQGLARMVTKSKIFVSLSLKGERWRLPLRPKSQKGKLQMAKRRRQLPLRKMNLSSRSKLSKIRKLQSRKGLLVARVARSPLAPLRHHLGALHPPSLAMLTIRGLTKIDIHPRRGEQTSPQKQGWRIKLKRVRRRWRKAARRSSPPLPLEGGVPGLPLPLRTLTTVRVERSTG